MEDFNKWFNDNQFERCHWLQRQSAQAAWDYQQAKLQVAVEALENIAESSPYARAILKKIKAK